VHNRQAIVVRWSPRQLLGAQSEHLKLPAPFGRWIAEPLDAKAAGQAAFHCCFDQTGCEEGERNAHIDVPSAAYLACAKLSNRRHSTRDNIIQPLTTSRDGADQRARRSNCSGRMSLRDALCGNRISRALLDGGLCHGIVTN
jgi:hypothetical protein